MISRRNLIKNVSLISAASLLTQAANASTVTQHRVNVSNTPPLDTLRFGVIADPQYAAIPSNKGSRFYANSLWKLEECIAAFNQTDLHFVITLGDMIDRHWSSYDDILPIYDRLRHPNFFVLGNHDYSVAADYLQSVARINGLDNTYYDFSVGQYRFIVLDGNDVSLFAPPKGNPYLGLVDDPRIAIATERLANLQAKGAINAKSWNGSLSETQFNWLKLTLAAANENHESVIVFCHYPVFPANEHNLWDSEELVELLTAYPNVLAYFCGHNHQGNYGKLAGKHFINLKGMVETPTTTAYSIVTLSENRLDIEGFGREESRSLAI